MTGLLTGGQSAALVVALGAPVAGAIAVVTGRLSPVARVVQASAAVSAAAWVLLLCTGARGRAAVFHVSPLVAAGGCGVALLAAAALDGARRDHRAVVGTVLALVASSAGLAGGGGSGQVVLAGAVLAGLVVATAASVDALPPPERRATVLFALAGLGAAIVGFVLLRAGGDGWSLPSTGTVPRASVVAFVLAGAALVVAGTLTGRRPTAVLLAGGLVLGLAAGPLRAGTDDLAAVAIGLALLAVAAAATGRGATALGLLALAGGAGPAALVPASRLLAAGSVVAAAVDRPAAWLTAVPGAVALAVGVVDTGGPLATGIAVAASLVAATLAVRATGPAGKKDPVATGPDRPWATPGIAPAVIVGAWLTVSPGAWTWTGASLRSYDRGMALAVGAGLVTVAAALAPELRLLTRSAPQQAPRGLRRVQSPGGPPWRRSCWRGAGRPPSPWSRRTSLRRLGRRRPPPSR